MCTGRYGKSVTEWVAKGGSVSWEESHSVIQLCARQEGNGEEKNTEELREMRKEGTERKKEPML